jgi:hypothetical protein
MSDFEKENSLFEPWGEDNANKSPREFELTWPDKDIQETIEIENDPARLDAKTAIDNGSMHAEFQMFLAGPLNMDLGEGRLEDPEIVKLVLDALAKVRLGGYEQALSDVELLADSQKDSTEVMRDENE